MHPPEGRRQGAGRDHAVVLLAVLYGISIMNGIIVTSSII